MLTSRSRTNRIVALALTTFTSAALSDGLASAQTAAAPTERVATLESARDDGRTLSGAIRLPAGWTSTRNGAVLLLAPSADDAVAAPGLNGIFSVEPWDRTISLTSPDTVERLRQQYLAVVEGFVADGAPSTERGELRMRFSHTGADGAVARIHLYVKTVEDRVITLAIAGPATVILDRAATWEAMFASTPSGEPARTPESDGMKELLQTTGGYALRHPPTWTSRLDGSAAILLPDPNALTGSNPEFYALNSMPWSAGRSLEEPAVAEEAAREFLTETPGFRRDGAIEKLDGGGVVIRCSGADAEGRPIRLRILARNNDRTVVGLVTMGNDESIAAREGKARELFATVRFVERSNAAPGTTDAAVVGRWSTDDILSSGSGFDASGTTSMVTQRIFEFGADGTFTLGSRSAGGNADLSFGSSFEITARGRWTIERGANGSRLLLTDERGATSSIRYAMHEGQLVLGEPGSRKFYSRLR